MAEAVGVAMVGLGRMTERNRGVKMRVKSE